MKISSTQIYGVNNYNHKRQSNKNINFGYWERTVGPNFKTLKSGDKILHRNNVYWFREGIPEIIDDLVKIYKDTNRVNMNIYACSNGSGVCSALIYLLSKYGEDLTSKFGLFLAKDIDPYAIELAKQRIMPISLNEFIDIQKYTHGGFNRFFNGEKYGLSDELLGTNINLFPESFNKEIIKIFNLAQGDVYNYWAGAFIEPKKEVTKNIKYSVANIIDDYVNIEPENSVVSARDMWPYLTIFEIKKLLANLGQHLKKGSSLIFGNYDYYPREYNFGEFFNFLDKNLQDNGFSPYKGRTNYIYIKD